MSNEWVSTHEWDVRAPIDTVFDTLADVRTYPDWWQGVYKEVHAEGQPGQGWGAVARIISPSAIGGTEHRIQITRYERPTLLELTYDSSEFPKIRRWILEARGPQVHVKVETHTHSAGLMDKLMMLMPGFRSQADYMMGIAQKSLGPYLQSRS